MELFAKECAMTTFPRTGRILATLLAALLFVAAAAVPEAAARGRSRGRQVRRPAGSGEGITRLAERRHQRGAVARADRGSAHHGRFHVRQDSGRRSIRRPVHAARGTTVHHRRVHRRAARQVVARLQWPVQGRVVTWFFGRQADGHRGLTIAGTPNGEVRSAAGGTVAYVGNELRGMGTLLLIRHDNGYITVYGKLHRADVRRGARVQAGQVIGRLPNGMAGGRPELYFEVRSGRRAVNPMRFLQ